MVEFDRQNSQTGSEPGCRATTCLDARPESLSFPVAALITISQTLTTLSRIVQFGSVK